jgi:signal transduction histidine kinase
MLERRSVWRVGPDSTWTTVLPVAFIILSLVSLLVLPIVVANHTSRMRAEITRVAEPARRAANQIQVDLAAELDRIIAFQVTGQASYRAIHDRLVAQQAHNRRVLAALTPNLGGDLDQRLAALFAQTGRWHDGIRGSELLARQLPAEVFQTRLFEHHVAYEEALLAASELELALQTSIEERLQSIRDAERWNRALTILLALLALTSALLVARLGRQMRLLAAEAVRQRHDAQREAAEAKKARQAAEGQERRAAFLASAGQELAASLDYQETMATLARLVVPNVAEACVVDIVEEGRLRRAAVKHRDPETESRLLAGAETRGEMVPEALVRLMEQREARLVGGTSGLYEYAVGADDGANRTVAVIPLVSRGQILGVVIAVAPESRLFNGEDLILLTDLARHAALAVDNARLYLESQQAVRVREEVLAIVSHDLRNPLNAVTLAAGLLRSSPNLTAEDREYVETLDVSAKRMTRLIDDLLDVTRLEGGKRLPIEPAPVDVPSLIDEVHELFKAQAAAGSITLQKRVEEDLPSVRADLHRVLQVFSNLIGNALKFTPAEGLIAFGAKRREGAVVFHVSDSGPGIPREHLKDIFTPYWQAKRTERLGAGLGLPIARGIVEAHGGRIWVGSEPGAGTTFFFTLPVEDVPAVRRAEESPAHR